MDLAYWTTFLGAALLLTISPGPDLLFVLSTTLREGRRAGMAAVLGTCTGAAVHVAAAGVGVAAILARSALAYEVLKCAGGLYLLYVGWATWRAPSIVPDGDAGSDQAPGRPAWTIFRSALLVDLINPKAALFFLSFLPQFLRAGHGAATAQFCQLGACVIGVALLVETSLVCAAQALRRTALVRPAWARRLNKVFAVLLCGMGGRLLAGSA